MSALNIPPGRRLPALDTQLRRVLTQAVSDTGLNSAEIARRAGLHRTTVAHVISGRHGGSLDTWDLILTAAGVQLGYRHIPEHPKAGTAE